MIKKWINLFIYNPDTKKMHWENIIPPAGVLIALFSTIYFDNKRLDRLKRERENFRKYTIGFTTGEHNNVKGSMVVDYDYFFAGSKYSSSNTTQKWLIGKPNTHGGRYYVVFAYSNPTNVRILFNYPVPEKAPTVPDSGWEYMPGYENVKVVE
jgi:hypothetical protein